MGKNVLPVWKKECVKKLTSIENHTAADLVNNWNDCNNEIFNFSLTSEEGL